MARMIIHVTNGLDIIELPNNARDAATLVYCYVHTVPACEHLIIFGRYRRHMSFDREQVLDRDGTFTSDIEALYGE